MTALTVRPARPSDAEAMADLLNRIIAIGGTTAHEDPFSPDRILTDYIDGPHTLTCFAGLDGDRLIGFQATERHPGLPEGWADIGTFVLPGIQRGGVGSALFAATKAATRAAGITTINATIRADNAPGLGYYARCGFSDYAHDPDFALNDGTRVGRISRRFDLI